MESCGKNVEERSIPWSQQVDEESRESLLSSIEEKRSSGGGSGAQFESSSLNFKDDRDKPQTSNNGLHGNYSKKNSYNNSWNSYSRSSSQQIKVNINDSYKSEKKPFESSDKYKSRRGVQNLSQDNISVRAANNNRSTDVLNKPDVKVCSVPKKATWASIASQPAKSMMRTSSTPTIIKKKGPGMPPPPMVPGKHNLDIGTWDSLKNGSVIAPTPAPAPAPAPTLSPPVTHDTAAAEVASSSTSKNISSLDFCQGLLKQVDLTNENLPERSSHSDTNPSESVHSHSTWVSELHHTNMGYSSKSVYTDMQHPHPKLDKISNLDRQQQGSNKNHAQFHSHLSENENQYFDGYNQQNASSPFSNASSSNHPVLEELRDKNDYNPIEIDLERVKRARFFVIKSYSEDDIHRSIKYEIWCSTEHGNRRLDEAFKERKLKCGSVFLFFSVNGSGHFCGMAQMMTPVDYNSVSSVWSQDKWKGTFKVKWVYVKDVPNQQLRHIRLENNENKSVTHSRDTQEVPNAQGVQVLQIFHSFKHHTSIFDDFCHYEKRQEQEVSKRHESPFSEQQDRNAPPRGGPFNKFYRPGDRNDDDSNREFQNLGREGEFRGKPINNQNDHCTDGNRRNNDYRILDWMSRDNKSVDSHSNLNRDNNNDYNNRNFKGGDYMKRDQRDVRSFLRHNNRDFQRNGGIKFSGRYTNRSDNSGREIRDNFSKVS